MRKFRSNRCTRWTLKILGLQLSGPGGAISLAMLVLSNLSCIVECSTRCNMVYVPCVVLVDATELSYDRTCGFARLVRLTLFNLGCTRCCYVSVHLMCAYLCSSLYDG